MKALLKSRYLISVVKTILLLAVIHMIALVSYAIKTGSYEVLNIFNIVGITYLVPELGKGPHNFIFSLVLLAILYSGVFFL
jgi:hypothetical protein